jgi:hypothetical protein
VFDHRAIEIIGPVSSTAWFKLPQIAFVFDVQSPPDPQFAYARQKFIKGAREWSLPRRPTRHIKKYLTYLRLLDFKEHRIPNKEIGSYLFPRKSGEDLRDTISKNRAAALRCQKDYLSIVFGSPP